MAQETYLGLDQMTLFHDEPVDETCYGTRTSHRWAKGKPSNLDTCNLRVIWPSRGPYHMPVLGPTDFEPTMLGAWNNPNGEGGWRKAAEEKGAIHFFIDDYRFEGIWRAPEKTLEKIQYVGAAVTPDFSVCWHTPRPMQLWQTYRQRWMGAWWQWNHVKVIPSVRWAERETWDFVFEGLPEYSHIAVGELGPGSNSLNDDLMREHMSGFEEMLKRLKPTKLLVYGSLNAEANWLNLPEVKEYPTFWQSRAKEIKEKTDTGEETSWHQSPPEEPSKQLHLVEEPKATDTAH